MSAVIDADASQPSSSQAPAVPQVDATQPAAAPSNSVDGMPIYDLSGEKPILGTVAHGDVQQAISSGKYAFPNNAIIHVKDPEGNLGTIDPADAFLFSMLAFVIIPLRYSYKQVQRYEIIKGN